MRVKLIAMVVSVLCFIAVSAFAVDVTGTWVAERTPPKMGPSGGAGGGPGGGPGFGGPMKFTFTFKVDGSNLSGTMVGPRGTPNEIIEGKIEGDKVSFAVKIDMMGREMKINYKGTVSGDEMTLNSTVEGGMGGMGGPGGGGMERPPLIAKRQK
jgi:hypothetical protein